MSQVALERVKKHNNYLFLNTKPNTANPTWARVGKSTEWTDTMNAETETFDYIEDTAPTDEIKTYKPSASIPHTAYIGDPSYDYVFGLYFRKATGTDAVTQYLKVYQQKNADSGANLARSGDALITVTDYNIATGILTYTVTERGTAKFGTAAISDDVPVFTENGAAEPTDP